jgi:hypothetical protein
MTAKGITCLDDFVAKQGLTSSRDNSLDWTKEFEVTIEEAKAFADPDFIIDGLIVRGQLHIIAAAPNGGKTTIFFHLSGEMVAQGLEVVYVHADVSGGDSKIFVNEAAEEGITLLLPDMKPGKSMSDVVMKLEGMNRDALDLSGKVFVFDTLKKMADLINKSATKRIMSTLRGLTAKGATVICLAHTNKYDGKDGKPIYEGTGDVRSDVDNLIYLIPDKHSDGSMTVSVEPDKQRAALEKMSFKISPEREVTRLDEYQDIAGRKQAQNQKEKDQSVIEKVTVAIRAGKSKQSDIIKDCKANGLSERQSRNVLKRYAKGQAKLWNVRRGAENNSLLYELCENPLPL